MHYRAISNTGNEWKGNEWIDLIFLVVSKMRNGVTGNDVTA